jgi:hypothetical protein
MSEIPPEFGTAESSRATEGIGVPPSWRSPEERARECLHLRGLVRRVLMLPGLSEQDRRLLTSEDGRAEAELDALAAAGIDLSRLTGGIVPAGAIRHYARSSDRR